MSTMLNDRDVLLRAGPRNVNAPGAGLLLVASSPVFHTNGAGAVDPAEIKFRVTRVGGLIGAAAFAATGGATLTVAGDEATLIPGNMPGATTDVSATVTANGQTFTSNPCSVGKVIDGAAGTTARSLALIASSQVFQINKAGVANLANIALTARQQGLGGTPNWTVPAGTATLSAGVDNWNKSLTFANTGSDSVTIRVEQDGQFDTITIVKVREGSDSITPSLTNESANVAATSAGVVGSFSGAGGTFKLYDGAVEMTGNAAVVYSVFSETGVDVSIAATGVYTVNSMSADTGVAVLRAVYKGLTFDKIYTISKTKQGVPGMDGAQSLVKPIWHSDWAGGTVVSVTDGKVGTQVRRSIGYSETQWTGLVPLDRTRVYRTRFWARAAAGTNGVLYHDLRQFMPDGSAGPDNGGRNPYQPANIPAHTDWREYSNVWMAGNWQPGVTQIKPDFLLNYRPDAVALTGYWEVQDYSFTDVTEAYNAQKAAELYAVARADLARTQAEAYADGVVTAEEERAIADATAKAEEARVAAVNAAAADATAKANVAATTANSDNSIRTPIGGKYVATGQSDVLGSLRIRLPQFWSGTMMRFTVDIFEYIAGYSCTLEIAGYNYAEGIGAWYNVSARVIGGSNVEYPVRFGHDGTKCCVWIGDANTHWTYPQVQVRDFFGGYLNAEKAKWESGWAIAFEPGGPLNVTAQVLDTYPAADWRKTVGPGRPADNATVGAPAGTNVGITPATIVETGAANGTAANNTLNTAFTVSLANKILPNTGTGVRTFTHTGTVQGGRGTLTYSWILTEDADFPGLSIYSGANAATVTLRSLSKAQGTSAMGWLELRVTDSGGFSRSAFCNVESQY